MRSLGPEELVRGGVRWVRFSNYLRRHPVPIRSPRKVSEVHPLIGLRNSPDFLKLALYPSQGQCELLMRLIRVGIYFPGSLFLLAKDPAEEFAKVEEQLRKMAPFISAPAKQLPERGIARGDTRGGWREWYEEPFHCDGGVDLMPSSSSRRRMSSLELSSRPLASSRRVWFFKSAP